MQVLDMCAAPGSKTAQLVEFLHADGNPLPSTCCHIITVFIVAKRYVMEIIALVLIVVILQFTIYSVLYVSI